MRLSGSLYALCVTGHAPSLLPVCRDPEDADYSATNERPAKLYEGFVLSPLILLSVQE